MAALIDRGWVVRTQEIEPTSFSGLGSNIAYLLEHEKVRWVSFPYEWGFAALKAAALLHLDIQMAALEKNVVLSDASAYNVQFNGSKPVFIDVLSMRRYREGELWTGQRQFVEQFLNPLLLASFTGVPYNAWYRGSLEGIESAHLNRVIPLWRKFDWKVFANVTLPNRIQPVCSKSINRRTWRAQVQ